MPRALSGLPELHALARRQGGVVTREQARGLGVDSRAVRRRLESGEWRLWLGCIILDEHSESADRRDAWAIGLRCGPDVVITGPTALRLNSWHIPDALLLCWSDREDHVRVDPIRFLRDGATRQTRPGPACAIASSMDALLDTALAVPEPRAVGLLDHALQRHWITPESWSTAVAGRAVRGRPGSTRLRRLALMAQDGTHSAAERLAATIMREAGLRGWVANYPLRNAAGHIIAELDFALVGLKICIEIDGRAYHSNDVAFEGDRARQNMLAAEGWLVLRFTWLQLTTQRDWVIATIRQAIALRSAP